MRTTFVCLLIALSPLGPTDAYADSDGYYCIGRGYLAYQFGMNVPQNPPRVSVLRTDVSGGIPVPGELRLPPFQVGRMRCGDGWVDVAASDTVYRIILDSNTRPVRYEVRPLPDGPAGLSAFPLLTPNLATLSRARALMTERVELGTTDRGTDYVLVTTAAIIPPAEQCRTAITTRVVEVDRGGKELGTRTIFQGEGHRECGE